MSSTAILLTILVVGGGIGCIALYSPQLSKWSHKKAALAKSNRTQR